MVSCTYIHVRTQTLTAMGAEGDGVESLCGAEGVEGCEVAIEHVELP